MTLRTLLVSLLQREVSRRFWSTPVAEAAAHSTENAPQAASVAILFALGLEARGTLDQLGQARSLAPEFPSGQIGQIAGRTVAVIETGVGLERAARACIRVLDQLSPQLVISAGFAGGLQPQLRRGQIVLANRAVHAGSGEALALPLPFASGELERLRLECGTFVSVGQLLRTREDKLRHLHEFQALACDMETFAVAKACQARGVSFLAVRILSDALDDELSPEVQQLMEQPNLARQMGAAVGALWKRPALARELWRLRAEAQTSSQRLGRFLASLVT